MFSPFSGRWAPSPATEAEKEAAVAAVAAVAAEADRVAADAAEAITMMKMMAELEFYETHMSHSNDDSDWGGCMCEDELAAIHEATEQAKANGLTLHAFLVSEPKPKPLRLSFVIWRPRIPN